MKLLCLLMLVGLASAMTPLSAEYSESELSFGIFDKIMDRVIHPYIAKIKASLERVQKSLIEKSENAKEILQEEAGKLIEILKPAFIRIFDLLNNMGANVDNFLESARTLFKRIVTDMKHIANENKEVLLSLIEHVMDKISAIIKARKEGRSEELEIAALVSYADNSIIDRIKTRLLQPIIDRITGILVRIVQAMKEHAPRLHEIINQQINEITRILKPSVVRIMDLLNNVGANVTEMVSNIRTALRSIIENIKGINEEQRKALYAIVNRIIDLLIGAVSPDNSTF